MRFILFIFLILSSVTFSQKSNLIYSIKGEIFNENQTEIKISIVNASTNLVVFVNEFKTKTFKIDSLISGIYYFSLSSEEYEDILLEIKIDSSSVDIGNITLKKINEIETVTIKVDKPKISLETGKITISVKDEPYFEGQKAIDIISKLPGISIVNGNILNNGIRVNNVRIDNIEYSIESAIAILESLSNNEIDKISLIKESFSKEDASSIGGIIEIKTFKNKRKSHYFNILSDIGYGQKFRNNQGLSYSFSKKKVNITLAFYRNDNLTLKQTTYNRFYKNTNLNLFQEINTQTDQTNYPIRLYFDYEITKNHSVSLNHFGFPQKSKVKIYDFNNGFRDSLNFTLQVNNSIEHRNFNNESVFQYTFINDSLDFNIKLKGAIYSFNQFSNGNLIEENKCNFCSDWIKNFKSEFRNNNSNSFIALDFMNLLLKDKLKINYGGKFSLIKSKSKQSFISNQTLDSLKSFNNNYDEKIYASYFELKYTIYEKLNFNCGIRYELTKNLGQSIFTNSTYIERNYADFFPSIGFTYIKSKMLTISSYASRKIERPNINQLAPSLLYYDSLSLKIGNPLLKPTYSTNFGIDFLLRKVFLFSLFYQEFKDYQFNIAYPIHPSSDVYVLGMYNYKKAKIIGFNISSPLPSFKSVKLYINSGFSYREFLISDDNFNNGSNYYLGFSPSYTNKNKRLIINSYLNIITPNLNGAFENEFMYKFDFGVYYCLLKEKNLKIGIHGYDIFNSYINNVKADLTLIKITGREINDIQSFYLKINYTIGIKGKEEILTEKEDRTRLTE